jgi:hypothetical protein
MIDKISSNLISQLTTVERPKFSDITSYAEFTKYYWYCNELKRICKSLDIDHLCCKKELYHNIEQYFNGNIISKKNRLNSSKSNGELTLTSGVLNCGFSFNKKFRDFFSTQTGIKNFKFNADMATSVRKAKQNRDKTFSLQDLLDIFYGKKQYAKYDKSILQWNMFVKDFCSDKNNKNITNKLKAASILWETVRKSAGEKIYTPDLMIKYRNLVKKLV